MFLFLSLASNMQDQEIIAKGLGQLEAYADAEEGVALQMDNGLIWDSSGLNYVWAIQGVSELKYSSKFLITTVSSGKVMLRNWRGMILALRPACIDPDTYPLLPVSYTKDPSLSFEVFYRNNMIAFQASNGLFLARVYRSFHTIGAAKAVADDTCFFRPLVGDIIPPKFEIIEVTLRDSVPSLHRSVIMTKTFINSSKELKIHTFTMTWETTVTDKISWERLWGLGVPVSHWFRIHRMRAKLKYTWDNEKDVSVRRNIFERHVEVVVVPSKSVCKIYLYAKKRDKVTVPFTAIIHKLKPNGKVVTLHERGNWTGLLYYDTKLRVKIVPWRRRSTNS